MVHIPAITPKGEDLNTYQIFFTGYAVGSLTTVLINIGYHKMTLINGRSKRNRSNQNEQTIDNDLSEHISIKPKPIKEDEQEKSVNSIVQTLIYKIHGGKKPGGNYSKSETGSNKRDLEEISLDGSKPHHELFLQKKSSLRIFSTVILSICISILLFIIFSRTFPDNYLDRFKLQHPQQTVPIIENKNYPALNQSNGEYWYIIELQSGENIITQNAIETDGVISVLGSDGGEKKFRRNDVKSVKKTPTK